MFKLATLALVLASHQASALSIFDETSVPEEAQTFQSTILSTFNGISDQDVNDNLFSTIIGADLERILNAKKPGYEFSVAGQEVDHKCYGEFCDATIKTKEAYLIIEASCQPPECVDGVSTVEDLVGTRAIQGALLEIASEQFPGVESCTVSVLEPARDSKEVRHLLSMDDTDMFLSVKGLPDNLDDDSMEAISAFIQGASLSPTISMAAIATITATAEASDSDNNERKLRLNYFRNRHPQNRASHNTQATTQTTTQSPPTTQTTQTTPRNRWDYHRNHIYRMPVITCMSSRPNSGICYQNYLKYACHSCDDPIKDCTLCGRRNRALGEDEEDDDEDQAEYLAMEISVLLQEVLGNEEHRTPITVEFLGAVEN